MKVLTVILLALVTVSLGLIIHEAFVKREKYFFDDEEVTGATKFESRFYGWLERWLP